MFSFGKKNRTVKYYADGLYDLDGYYMRKRRQKNRPLTDKSAEIRAGLIKNYILPLWSGLDISDLSVKRIDDDLVNVLSFRDKKDLSGTIKNTILLILDNMFSVAIDDGIINNNPVKSIMRFSQAVKNQRGAIPKKEMDLLFPTNHDELIKIWRKQIYATAYLVLRDTGLRPGELRALQWGDWYPDLRFFPITKAIESGKRDKIKSTKTGSVKPAVISEQTARELEILKNSVKDCSPKKFIFADRRGLPLTICSIAYNFKAGVLRAGLDKKYSPYWLRHTFNTRMLDVLPDDTVRLLMGHATEAMTLHYRHPDIESLKREAEKIKNVLNNSGY
jgi:integrase